MDQFKIRNHAIEIIKKYPDRMWPNIEPERFLSSLEKSYAGLLQEAAKGGSFGEAKNQLEKVRDCAQALADAVDSLTLTALWALHPPSPEDKKETNCWLTAGGDEILQGLNEVASDLGDDSPLLLASWVPCGRLSHRYSKQRLEAFANYCDLRAGDLEEKQSTHNGKQNAILAERGSTKAQLLRECACLLNVGTYPAQILKDLDELAKLVHQLVTEEPTGRQWLRYELKVLSGTPS